MRLRRFVVLFLVAASFSLLPAFAQTSQSQDASAPATQAQPPQPSQPPSGLVHNPFVKQPQAVPSPEWSKISSQRPRQLPDVREAPGHSFNPAIDKGIFLRSDAGTGNTICEAIVSYNFSRGDSPHVESVTTCTSTNKVIMRQAEGDETPRVPRLVQTSIRPK
ncbi:MAG TPA: hypothetical protein VKY85_04085 [Candidatus Angelobacter sp.]|nr:hypothetical protein [Candidatus Angelobacter sp.]